MKVLGCSECSHWSSSPATIVAYCSKLTAFDSLIYSYMVLHLIVTQLHCWIQPTHKNFPWLFWETDHFLLLSKLFSCISAADKLSSPTECFSFEMQQSRVEHWTMSNSETRHNTPYCWFILNCNRNVVPGYYCSSIIIIVIIINIIIRPQYYYYYYYWFWL